MADIYICASTVDRDWLFPAVDALEAAGFSCFLPNRDLDFGIDWEETMTDAVYTSIMVIYVDSEAARRSMRIWMEMKTIKESRRLIIETDTTITPEQLVSVVRDRIGEARNKLEQLIRLIPYTGDEAYIFVSYAHKNMDKVFPLIRLLQQNGYRIWFDEGIDPGTEWAENIASHLEGSSFLIACMSKEYLESTNCSDELFYAREMDIPVLLIYLEPLVLKGKYRMKCIGCPSVDAPLAGEEEQFLSAVEQTEGIRICRRNEGEDAK